MYINSQGVQCIYPIIIGQHPPYCNGHMDLVAPKEPKTYKKRKDKEKEGEEGNTDPNAPPSDPANPDAPAKDGEKTKKERKKKDPKDPKEPKKPKKEKTPKEPKTSKKGKKEYHIVTGFMPPLGVLQNQSQSPALPALFITPLSSQIPLPVPPKGTLMPGFPLPPQQQQPQPQLVKMEQDQPPQ
jgi:hypothetical protein